MKKIRRRLQEIYQAAARIESTLRGWGFIRTDTLESQVRQLILYQKRVYRGDIQRQTDEAYVNTLNKIGAPLTDVEREIVRKQSKYYRQADRGLRNKPKADEANRKRSRRGRVEELEALYAREGVPLPHDRAAKMLETINSESPERPVTLNYVQRLRRSLRK